MILLTMVNDATNEAETKQAHDNENVVLHNINTLF